MIFDSPVELMYRQCPVLMQAKTNTIEIEIIDENSKL